MEGCICVCVYIYINIKGILVILLTEKKIINDQCLEGNGLFLKKKKKKKLQTTKYIFITYNQTQSVIYPRS